MEAGSTEALYAIFKKQIFAEKVGLGGCKYWLICMWI
jgi:hypothetical protein